MLPELERYYDAAPRSAAHVEEVGPFTLFVGTGAWPYYARPRLGGTASRRGLEAVRERQRALGVRRRSSGCTRRPRRCSRCVRAAGLEVPEAPLMVLDRAVWRAPEPPPGMTLRVLDADDGALAAARAVQNVAFGAAGTAAGPEGLTERDAAADDDGLDSRASGCAAG